MRTKLELIDGNIFIVVTQLVWGEELEVSRTNVTNEAVDMVDKLLFNE